MSVFWGSLAVFTLALISPWAGFFLAIDTFSVKYTSVIYLESLPLFLSALSVITSVKWMDSYQDYKKLTRSSLVWFVMSAATLGLAVASKYMYGVAGIAIVLYALFLAVKNRPRLLWMILAWCAAAILFFCPG